MLSERKDAEYAADLSAPPSQGLGEKAVRPSSFKAERGGSVSATQKGMVLPSHKVAGHLPGLPELERGEVQDFLLD